MRCRYLSIYLSIDLKKGQQVCTFQQDINQQQPVHLSMKLKHKQEVTGLHSRGQNTIHNTTAAELLFFSCATLDKLKASDSPLMTSFPCIYARRQSKVPLAKEPSFTEHRPFLKHHLRQDGWSLCGCRGNRATGRSPAPIMISHQLPREAKTTEPPHPLLTLTHTLSSLHPGQHRHTRCREARHQRLDDETGAHTLVSSLAQSRP